jgi:hypothetical protein
LTTYRTLVDRPHYFKANEAVCLALLGKVHQARITINEVPSAFDVITYAKNCAKVCALQEDAELWLDGFRKAGVAIWSILIGEGTRPADTNIPLASKPPRPGCRKASMKWVNNAC